MTIAVNGRFLKARATGLHRVGRGLIDAARRRGMELDVIAPPGTEDPRVDRTVWAPPGVAGEHLWEQVLLPLAARGRLILSLANTAPLGAGRSVVMVHDLAPRVEPRWYTARGRAYGRLSLAAARRARGVLVPSEQVRTELERIGIGRERVWVVRPAVDAAFRPAGAAEIERIRRRYGLERPYVLHVGWSPRKDVATVARAHLEVASEQPHDLVLTGVPHPTMAPIDLPAAPSIRRVGYVRDEDLPPLLSGSVALVFPTLYEGFGLPPLEAAACGTIPIVSDLPVLHESAGAAAFYVAPGDVRGWADALRAALRGDLAVGVPPPWTWDDTGDRLEAALDALGSA